MMPVIMKTFEYELLERVLPVLQEYGHPALAQTAYQKHVSCQDAIFAIYMKRYGNLFKTAVTPSLYDLEKAYDSIEHPVLIHALYNAGVNGKSCQVPWISMVSLSIG